MLGAAFKWTEWDDQSNLRYNFHTVAWVKLRDGIWYVELHHWKDTLSYRVASRATGKPYVERWVAKAGGFWASPYRKHDRRPFQKKPTVHVPGFEDPMSARAGFRARLGHGRSAKGRPNNRAGYLIRSP